MSDSLNAERRPAEGIIPPPEAKAGDWALEAGERDPGGSRDPTSHRSSDSVPRDAPVPRDDETGETQPSPPGPQSPIQHPVSDFSLILQGAAILVALIAWGEVSFAPLRVVLGLAYVLFVPGYCLSAAIFPRQRELDSPERLAVSFGLSVAIVPMLAFILGRLPWGLQVWSMIIALGIVILAGMIVGAFRRGRLDPSERFQLFEGADLGDWWHTQGRAERIGTGVLGLALAAVLVSMGAILFLPRPAERFTEFYLLGAEGRAEDYPRAARVGQDQTVTLGIVNREGAPTEYQVAVLQDGQPVAQVDPVQLDPGQTAEGPVQFTPIAAGDDVKIDFLLYRANDTAPYRSLTLWLTVAP